MKRLIFLLVVVALAQHATAAAKPNILFIAIDDQNDWIGCLGGHPQIRKRLPDGQPFASEIGLH